MAFLAALAWPVLKQLAAGRAGALLLRWWKPLLVVVCLAASHGAVALAVKHRFDQAELIRSLRQTAEILARQKAVLEADAALAAAGAATLRTFDRQAETLTHALHDPRNLAFRGADADRVRNLWSPRGAPSP